MQTRINWSVSTVLDFGSCCYYVIASNYSFVPRKDNHYKMTSNERGGNKLQRECGTVHVEPFFLLTVIFLIVGFLEMLLNGACN